jgi:heme/copper-type cytochrome/quinol oxidase subunit 4
MPVLRHRLTIVWLALMVATCVSTWMLSLHEFGALVATVGVLVIAGVKIHLVMENFMELRDGPTPVRVLYAGWIVVAVGVILGFYLATR